MVKAGRELDHYPGSVSDWHAELKTEFLGKMCLLKVFETSSFISCDVVVVYLQVLLTCNGIRLWTLVGKKNASTTVS